MSQRLGAHGYSRSEFNLRMTRAEIGSYLGLKLETVSRTFSRFQEEGLMAVQQKLIRILDRARLEQVTGREPDRTAVGAAVGGGRFVRVDQGRSSVLARAHPGA
ncbi:MAG: helix-turn-helix domain-containing protein, partial [Giesbergeria sp.]